jgi:hypothetical protein
MTRGRDVLAGSSGDGRYLVVSGVHEGQVAWSASVSAFNSQASVA